MIKGTTLNWMSANVIVKSSQCNGNKLMRFQYVDIESFFLNYKSLTIDDVK